MCTLYYWIIISDVFMCNNHFNVAADKAVVNCNVIYVIQLGLLIYKIYFF